jgi:hypothetical protein
LEAASQELDAAYARAVEIGLPLTLEEANGPIVPDEDNIVAGLRPLMDEWMRIRKSADKYQPSEPRPADMAAIDDDFLAKADEVLWRPKAQLQRYSLINGLDLYAMDSKTLSHFKEAAYALAWRARERASGGDSNGAAQDLDRMRRLAWALGQDITEIGALVALAIDAIAVDRIPAIAHGMRGDRASLARLREAVQSSWPQFSLRRSTRFSVSFSLDLARNVEALGGLNGVLAAFSESDDKVPSWDELPGWRSDGKPTDLEGRASMARLLQLYGQAWAAPEATNAEFAKALADADKILEKHEEHDKSYLLAWSVFTSAAQAGRVFFKSEVRHELAIAGLRVMEHRALTGKLPQSLREAGAVDKVQGREIHYAVKDGAFCVWTNGPDGVNQGPHFSIPEGGRPDDISMTFPPIKQEKTAL